MGTPLRRFVKGSLQSKGLLLLIIVIGISFRVVDTAEVGLGFNEPMHIYAAKSLLEGRGPELPSGLVYKRALLFTYTVAGSFKMFGVNLLSARLPSIVFGMLSVLLIFTVGKRFFGATAAMIAAFLMAAVPFEITWARACRMYAMYQFFFLLGFFAFYHGFETTELADEKARRSWIEKPAMRWGWLLTSALSMLVAFHLQPLAAVLGAGILIYLLSMFVFTGFGRGFAIAMRSKYFWFALVLLLPLPLVFAVPQLYAKLDAAYRFAPEWASKKGVSPLYYARFLVGPTLFPITVFAAVGILQGVSRLNRAAYYTATVFCIPLIFHSLLAKAQSYRYIYDVFPLLILLAAYGMANILNAELETLQQRLTAGLRTSRNYAAFQAVLVVILLGILFSPLAFALNDALHISKGRMAPLGGEFNAQWAAACRYVNKHWKDGDILVASIPLAAEFHGCKRVHYSLDNGEIDQFRKIEGQRFQLHPFADAKTIIDLQDLYTVLELHPRGWMVLDKGRFLSGNTPEDVREYLLTHLEEQKTTASDTILVFHWDKNHAMHQVK
ncbi:MAG: glycosyltransferase family 39 protein [Desulfosoma sp.]